MRATPLGHAVPELWIRERVLFTEVIRNKGGSNVPRSPVCGRAGGGQTSLVPAVIGVGSPDSSSVYRGRERGLEAAGRREAFHIVVASDELGIDEDLRHGRPSGRFLENLLNRPVARFPDAVQLRYIEAQATNISQQTQRVLRVGSVRLAEDDGGVA